MMPSKDIFIHPTAIIDEGCKIGHGTKIWHFCHLMSKVQIGQNCSLGQNVFIMNGVKVGDNVRVQNNVSLFDGVVCEDDVFIGPSAVFTNVYNPRSAVNRKNEFLRTTIKKGATIGANATIVCGNNIGAYSFVGAGSVITKEVKPYALMVGNPAKQIGWMSQEGYRLNFESSSEYYCSEEKGTYKLIEDQVIKL